MSYKPQIMNRLNVISLFVSLLLVVLILYFSLQAGNIQSASIAFIFLILSMILSFLEMAINNLEFSSSAKLNSKIVFYKSFEEHFNYFPVLLNNIVNIIFAILNDGVLKSILKFQGINEDNLVYVSIICSMLLIFPLGEVLPKYLGRRFSSKSEPYLNVVIKTIKFLKFIPENYNISKVEFDSILLPCSVSSIPSEVNDSERYILSSISNSLRNRLESLDSLIESNQTLEPIKPKRILKLNKYHLISESFDTLKKGDYNYVQIDESIYLREYFEEIIGKYLMSNIVN